MSGGIKDLKPVYVVGIGLHRYQFLSDANFVELGLVAVRAALADAGLEWPSVQSAYVARALLPMAAGRPILRHLGATGIPIVHIENASASGSAAFLHACIEIGSGVSDLSLVLGVDKPGPAPRVESLLRLPHLADDAIAPFTHFALLGEQYAARYKVRHEDIALVAVKNHRNGAKNPFAQYQKERSLEEILGGKKISGTLTSLQCTPIGEGAAALIIASEEGIKKFGLDRSRAIRVAGAASRSQRENYDNPARYDALLTSETAALAFHDAGITPDQIDIVELHDAFTIEEIEYVEAMSICRPGEAVGLLKQGYFDIGGRCAVSASGGLLAMGHPIGPTGVGQICEITRQLRSEAGSRQHSSAHFGLAHMVGLGAVCYVHILHSE